MRLHYAGTPGEGYGWGVCNSHLIQELGKLCELTGPESAEVVFMPLADHDFNPITTARARVNLALTFFESELGPNAGANAAKYDVVFCGSTWCWGRMGDRDIKHGEVLIQGVDGEIFNPPLHIFSGGKFEYRKGQDLVIAAFREFLKTHPGAHLVCSWFNPWPSLVMTSLNLMSDNIKVRVDGETMGELFANLIRANGISPSSFTIFQKLSHADLARVMCNTDIGLFPNRCEGGTNLVLMEYAACGKKIVANIATGHADVKDLIDERIPFTTDSQGWAVQKVEDIVAALERAAISRKVPTWKDAAKQILNRAEVLLKQKGNG